jgi:hypothetical protein
LNGKQIAMPSAQRIGGEALVVELGCEPHEVLPEMLLQNAEGEALAVLGLEHIVHREDVRARIDVGIQAVAHCRPEEGALEERKIEICALSFAQRSQDCDRSKGAAAHVGYGKRRARRRLEPLARKRERTCGRHIVDVVSRPLAPGPGLAVARDRAVDQLRVGLSQRLEIDAQALGHARAKSLEHDLRVTR